MRYEIVNKIIIDGGAVYLVSAPSHVRPLDFVRSREERLTALFADGGLCPMLEEVLRRVYHGQYHLRSASRITRALRESVHTVSLELIHALPERDVVPQLARMAEKLLEDKDYDGGEELATLQALLERQKLEHEEKRVQVRLFGQVEITNRLGTVAENRGRQPLSWALLKYLLCDPARQVGLEELLRQGVWPYSRPDVDEAGAARVRLRRLRESLKPLELDGVKGLVLFSGGRYAINPDYILDSDSDRFLALLGAAESAVPGTEESLANCRAALELLRGGFMEYTGDAPWLAERRAVFAGALARLAEVVLAGEDEALVELLCRRCAAVTPQDEALHRRLIDRLAAAGQTRMLTAHVSRLHAGGKAPWLQEE